MWLDNLSKGRVNNVIRGVFDWFIEQLKSKSNWKENKKLKREIKLLSSASKILAEMDVSLEKRLQRVMTRYNGDKEKTIPLVFLNTLHSSKGLEFDNVWLLQIDEFVIPDVKNTSRETEEEERRVMYVGMTRAKNALYVSCTKSPSMFIFEAGIELKDICD
jgi:DNA helicase-2/ATP-dependent DNA helicase PcrA